MGVLTPKKLPFRHTPWSRCRTSAGDPTIRSDTSTSLTSLPQRGGEVFDFAGVVLGGDEWVLQSNETLTST